MTLEETFWSHVKKTDECWLWAGAINTYGYGRCKGKMAHRVSYELNVGPIPNRMNICHHCDNPPCVRPDHLFAGTQSDNLMDASRKGRNASFRIEVRVKQSIAARRRIYTKADCQRIKRVANRPEVKAKKIAALKGKPFTLSHLAALKIGWAKRKEKGLIRIGRPQSLETRRKIRESVLRTIARKASNAC